MTNHSLCVWGNVLENCGKNKVALYDIQKEVTTMIKMKDFLDHHY